MWNIKSKADRQCAAVRERLEGESTEWDLRLQPGLREHFASCPNCREAAEIAAESRRLLKAIPPQMAASQWFVPRVMAAIAAREKELRRIGETWSAVPKLAARLTWASAFALLVASSWLYQAPQKRTNTGSDPAMESLFDNPQPQLVTKDDILVSLAVQK